jgi:hemoglobin
MKNDITNIGEVKILVDSFYNKVRQDPTLKDIFENTIEDKWSVHLEKMYRFWQTVLLTEHTYTGSPFPPHVKLGIGPQHFEVWLKLFKETIEDNFYGAKADEALWRAQKMAEMFQYKLDYLNNSTQNQLV